MKKYLCIGAIIFAGICTLAFLHHNFGNPRLRTKLRVELTNLHELGKISNDQYAARCAQLRFGDVYDVDVFVWNVKHQ